MTDIYILQVCTIWKNCFLSYVDDRVYWYTSDALVFFGEHYRENIPYELPWICTLVYVNNNFTAK